MQSAILLLNVVWHGSAFWFFGLQSPKACRVIVERAHRSGPGYDSLVATVPFLGGMNLAMAVLSLAFLIVQRIDSIVFLVHAVAHGSQFVLNIPYMGGRKSGAPWDVLRGLMLFIFVTDCACMLVNAGAFIAFQ